MPVYDFVVIGLGSVGSHIFRHLAERREGSVLGVEQFAPASTRTAAGGDTRLFRFALPEGAQYHPLITESLTQWRTLNEITGRRVLEETGCLYIGPDDHHYIRSLTESAEATGAAVEKVDDGSGARMYPQHHLLDEDVMLFDPVGGFIRTDLAVQSSVALGIAAGGQVHKHTPVFHITASRSGGFRIATPTSVITAGDVVVAGGSWSGQLLSPELRPFTHPRRTTLTWFGVTNPAAYAPDRFPVFKRVTPGIDVYGAPATDATMVKIALAESTPITSPDDVERSLTAEESSRIIHAVDTGLTSVIPDVIRSDAFPELYTTDEQPLIGRDPGTGVYVATGFSGKGFKTSAGVGKLAADALLGADIEGISFADPARFLPR